MLSNLKILYVNLGDNIPYTYDKISGRVLRWANKNNLVTLLIPVLSQKNINKEITSKNPENIKVYTVPLSGIITNSPVGIIISFLVRVIVSPCVLFFKNFSFDIAISNSAFLVDVVPILILKLFGRCRHWVLIMDSVVPHPRKRTGNFIVNSLAYYESLIVGKLANNIADAILTVNPELKNEMVKRGIDNKLIKLTQNGIYFKDIESIKGSKKKKFDAVYQGRVSDNKGIKDLILVWKNIVDKKPSAKLVIMGTGIKEYLKELKVMIKSHNLNKNIIYFGFVGKPKKYKIMKESKVFLYLSKINADESWGISLMEALACGLPAISYDLPIYKHIYNTNALNTIQIGDVKSVVKRLTTIIDNDQYKSVSLKAKSFAKNFDWNKIADKDLALLNDIMVNRQK